MENFMQYIPLAISAILLVTLILMVITNIIVQVLKKLTWDKIPTNILAFIVAMAVTLLAFFAVCQIMGWAVTWYMVAGAVALGVFLAGGGLVLLLFRPKHMGKYEKRYQKRFGDRVEK